MIVGSQTEAKHPSSNACLIVFFFFYFVSANEFPSSFESLVRKILRLLFHVLAHLYHCHFREVVLLNLHTQLNCVFAHLTLFNHTFQLIEPKETEILQDLVVALKIHSDTVSKCVNCRVQVDRQWTQVDGFRNAIALPLLVVDAKSEPGRDKCNVRFISELKPQERRETEAE